MKVLCFIDNLGSGGAQRQLCSLAVILRKRGCEVSISTYNKGDFFLPLLQDGGVPHRPLAANTPVQRIVAFRREIARFRPDVVLAFLPGPCLYAEIASLGSRSWGLIVSERSAVPNSHRSRAKWLRAPHFVADYVVTNSHSNRLMVERSFRRLQGRVVTIYNSVDLDHFAPSPSGHQNETRGLRIGVASSIQALKNPARFLRSFAMAKGRRPRAELSLLWCGRQPSRSDSPSSVREWEIVQRIIQEEDLSQCVQFEPPRMDVVTLYRWADVVSLPSLYEGLPNTVTEAMACALPILISDVSDAGNLVVAGRNGDLFNPNDEDSITAALLRMADVRRDVLAEYGRNSRTMAEIMFNPDTVVDRYLEVLRAAASRKRVAIENWVPQVPASALSVSV